MLCLSRFFSLIIFWLYLFLHTAWAGFIQLDAVADIKTRFSAGCSSIQELANLARHRKVDVVIFSDNDRRALEYGIVPFEKIFRKKREQPSILTTGVASYLGEVNAANQSFDDIILIPAVESAPFYYWSGNLAKKNLTANHIDKHLFLVGLEKPQDYEQLPILNSNFSKKYMDLFLKPFLIYAGGFFIFFILYIKNFMRKTAFFLMICNLLLAINNHPFKSSRFNPYHGDPGVAPYQEVIDYANSKGALTFWNHLEASESEGKVGAMGFKTLPHPEDMILSKNYTGFQAVYDGEIHVTDPGKEWDQTLMEYISGKRKQPVWGYGGNDFHCERDNGHVFGGVRSILLVREKSSKGVMEALRTGRMYPVKQTGPHRLSLDDFSILDEATGKSAVMGESLLATGPPEIKIKLRSTQGSENTFILSIIRNGKPIRREEAVLPYELNWRDLEVNRKGKTYYRIMAKTGPEDYLVSNPIFVSFTAGELEVASVLTQSVVTNVPPETPSTKIPSPPEKPKTPEKPQVKGKVQANQLPNTTESIKSADSTVPSTPKVEKEKKSRMVIAKPTISSVEPITIEQAKPTIKKPTPPKIPEIKSQKTLVTSTTKTQTTSIKTPKPVTMEKPPSSRIQTPVSKKRYVVALIDGVTLKNGPDIKFPEVMAAKKGEKLEFIRGLNKTFDDKPWLEVKKNGKIVYVWGGLVQPEFNPPVP